MNKIFEAYVRSINERIISIDNPVNGLKYIEIDTSKKFVGIKTDNWTSKEIKEFIDDPSDDRAWEKIEKAVSKSIQVKEWGDVLDGRRRMTSFPATFEPGQFDFIISYS